MRMGAGPAGLSGAGRRFGAFRDRGSGRMRSGSGLACASAGDRQRTSRPSRSRGVSDVLCVRARRLLSCQSGSRADIDAPDFGPVCATASNRRFTLRLNLQRSSLAWGWSRYGAFRFRTLPILSVPRTGITRQWRWVMPAGRCLGLVPRQRAGSDSASPSSATTSRRPTALRRESPLPRRTATRSRL